MLWGSKTVGWGVLHGLGYSHTHVMPVAVRILCLGVSINDRYHRYHPMFLAAKTAKMGGHHHVWKHPNPIVDPQPGQ